MRFSAKAGTTQTEYLMVALISLSTMGALTQVGGGMNTMLSALASDLTGSPVQGAQTQVVANAKGKANAGTSTGQNAGGGSTGSNATPATSPGSTPTNMMMPASTPSNTPTDLKQSVETLGANGTTALLADYFVTLADQLLAEGKIDQAGANALQALANQGHKIAEIENLVETMAGKAGADTNAFESTSVMYNGVFYENAYEMSRQLIGTDDTNANGDYNFAPEIDQFWGLYSDLWAAGVMNDPAVKASVQSNVQLIHDIADNTRVVGYNMIYNGVGDPGQFTTLQAAKISNGQAASICNTGGGYDSGTFCP